MTRILRARVIWGVLAGGVLVTATAAEAQTGSPVIWENYGAMGRSIYGMDYIPYYSRHPPVYYSYPIARAYGYSPYAYPPWVKTPEIERPRPALFHNEHVSAAKTVCEPHASTAGEPLRITNPYVVRTADAESAGSQRLVSRSGPRP